MSRVVVNPEVIESGLQTGGWVALIFDNDTTPFDDVIATLMKATGCSTDEAFIETWEAQEYGQAAVHFADRTECEIVATMMGTIGVRTLVRPEWND